MNKNGWSFSTRFGDAFAIYGPTGDTWMDCIALNGWNRVAMDAKLLNMLRMHLSSSSSSSWLWSCILTFFACICTKHFEAQCTKERIYTYRLAIIVSLQLLDTSSLCAACRTFSSEDDDRPKKEKVNAAAACNSYTAQYIYIYLYTWRIIAILCCICEVECGDNECRLKKVHAHTRTMQF